ncbi:MAG: hypothetical protein FWH26_03620 [Oscillospiraceae bacterium]|nr:hypothetical protein [Oscillospiraceae bacterium]
MPGIDKRKAAIQCAEDEIRSSKIEHGILFDLAGNILWKKNGEKDRIDFTRQEIKSMDGRIFSHNHPDMSPPAPKDVYMLWRCKLKELRTCNKYGSYSLKAPDQWKNSIEDQESLIAAYWAIDHRIGFHYRYIAAASGKSIFYYLDEIQEKAIQELCQKYEIEFIWEVLM